MRIESWLLAIFIAYLLACHEYVYIFLTNIKGNIHSIHLWPKFVRTRNNIEQDHPIIPIVLQQTGVYKTKRFLIILALPSLCLGYIWIQIFANYCLLKSFIIVKVFVCLPGWVQSLTPVKFCCFLIICLKGITKKMTQQCSAYLYLIS